MAMLKKCVLATCVGGLVAVLSGGTVSGTCSDLEEREDIWKGRIAAARKPGESAAEDWRSLQAV